MVLVVIFPFIKTRNMLDFKMSGVFWWPYSTLVHLGSYGTMGLVCLT